MKAINDLLVYIETYTVLGTAIMALVVAGIIGIIRIGISIIKDKKKYPYCKNYYFGFPNSFYITSVNEYIPDNTPSGYTQKSYPRPDMWNEKVAEVSFGPFIKKIIPIKKNDILAVMVRKNKKEKVVLFNRRL